MIPLIVLSTLACVVLKRPFEGQRDLSPRSPAGPIAPVLVRAQRCSRRLAPESVTCWLMRCRRRNSLAAFMRRSAETVSSGGVGRLPLEMPPVARSMALTVSRRARTAL